MAAMAVAAFLCIFIGCAPGWLYRMLPNPVEYHPYTSYHVSETLLLLLFTAVGFFLLLRKLEPVATVSLDLDWFYRRGGRWFLRLARRPLAAADDALGTLYRAGGLAGLVRAARGIATFDQRFIDGAVDGLASAVRGVGGRLRRMQRGAIQESLTVALAAGALLLALLLALS